MTYAEKIEVIRQMRELLAEESRWCKGFYARRADGSKCFSDDAGAVAWSLDGALALVLKRRGKSESSKDIVPRLSTAGVPLAILNDAMKHRDVVVLLDSTILHMDRGAPAPPPRLMGVRP